MLKSVPLPTVYIVKENASSKSILSKCIARSGHYKIVELSSGNDCLAKLKTSSSPLQVILLDHNIGRNLERKQSKSINALTTLRIAKRLYPTVKIITLVGAEEGFSASARMLYSGAYDYVIKGEINSNQKVCALIKKALIDTSHDNLWDE